MSADAADCLAAGLADLRYEDLPGELIEATKACILDTLGCLLAGSATREAEAVARVAIRSGGVACSTVIGHDIQLPPAAAVMVNAAAIHQYDFDDTHDIAVCHPTSTSLPPALALAEQRGGVSGRELLTAVALGNEITCRVAGAIGGRLHDYPWFRAPVVGLFGATAAAARMLGASADRHLQALGLALPMVGGTLASLLGGGSSVRSLRDGIAYRNGVLAAELAMEGLRGDPGVFDGRYGFYQVFFRGECRRDVLVGDFGTRWDAARVSLKPWPSIRHLHGMLTAIIDGMAERQWRFDDIESVTVRVGDSHRTLCEAPQPGVVPERRMDALRSLPFAAAAALRYGGVPLELYRNGQLADDLIVTAVPKVRWEYDASLNGDWTFEPARIELHGVNGQHHQAECANALGHPDNPMRPEQRRAKFLTCTAAARQPFSVQRVDEICELVGRLECLDDIAPLLGVLARA